MGKCAIFDRDGTLIRDVGYLSGPEKVELLKGVAETLSELKNRGYLIGIVSNQSGIGRGMFNETDCVNVNLKIEELLGFEFDAVEYCPHRPEDKCKCRKPAPYMIYRALENMHGNSALSFYAGDRLRDIQAGSNAGLKTIWCDFDAGYDEDASDIADFTIHSFPEILNCI